MELLFGYYTHLDATAFSASFNDEQQKQRKLPHPNKSIMMTPAKLQCEKNVNLSTLHNSLISENLFPQKRVTSNTCINFSHLPFQLNFSDFTIFP